MDKYDYLIKQYSPFVYSIASKFSNIDKEDLYQAGVQGLINAFNNYDETSNTKFTTYAYEYIYGQMYKLIYQSNNLKITKGTLRLYKKILKTYQSLSQQNLQTPSYYQIAEQLNISELLVETIMHAFEISLSLDQPYLDDMTLSEQIAKVQNITLDDKIFLKELIDDLPEPEKTIINYRYYYDLTQQQIAQILDTTQVKVSRYEKKGLEKMRVYARN